MGRVPGSLAIRRVAVLGLLSLFLAAPARAADHAGAVRVGPVRVEAPASMKGGRLRVQVAIGGKTLWHSPAALVPAAPWAVSLRAFTARRLPLVFRVLEDAVTAAPSSPAATSLASPVRRVRRPKSLREQDAALASGIADLVGDYGAGTLDDPGEPLEPAPASAESPPPRPGAGAAAHARCVARLAWPPADGEHRLACGPFTVVVRTSWVGK